MDGRARARVALVSGVVLLASCGGGSRPTAVEAGAGAPEAGAPTTAPASPRVATDEATTEAVGDEDLVLIPGTQISVPVPDPALGTQRDEIAIPLQDADATAHGVSFYRPGPISGTVVGGVAVVYDDSDAVLGDDGRVATADTIADRVDPGRPATERTQAGRTVLAWPDAEVISAEGIPSDEPVFHDRSVHRYVVLADHGIVMVTFDDVALDEAEAYIDAVAGAL